MVAPVLISDFTATTEVQVYTLLGAKVTALGDPFSITEEVVLDGAFNTVIHAFGSVYCYTKDGVHRLQSSDGTTGDTWSIATEDGGFAFPNTGGSSDDNIGIYYVTIDNEPYLFGVYPDASAGFRAWRYNLLTSTYEESDSIGSVNIGDDGIHVYYNGLVVTMSAAGVGTIIDPSSLNISAISGGAGTSWDYGSTSLPDLNVFNGELYMLHEANSDGFPSISKFGGGTFSRELSLDSQAINAIGNHCALFDDGTDMFAIYYQDLAGFASDGWICRQIDVTNGILSLGSDLSTTVLPPGVRVGSSTVASTGRWVAFKNQLTDGSYEIILWFSPDSSGSVWEQYLWNGTSTAMSLQDIGGDSQFHLPNTKQGGGERVFESDSPTVAVYARSRVAGGEEVTFRCFGGQTDQVVRFYVGSGGEVPEVQAQLSGTATGGTATRNGNQVESVDCDGATDYTITILATGTFDDNERIELTARIHDS